MSDTTPFLGLPYIAAAQAQKHVTHNEALRSLDRLVQLSVQSDSQTAPPDPATEGDRYIVPTGATGGWSGQSGTVAVYADGQWQFLAPALGWRAWVADAGSLTVYDGTGWIHPLDALAEVLDGVTRFGLNATTDANAPFIVRAPQALWDAVPQGSGGSGDMIQSINREGTTDDAGLALQTAYTTQGLIGFFGSDLLRLSVSPDGVTFQDALALDPASGIATQPQRPRFSGTVNFAQALPVDSWTKLQINDLTVNPQGAFDAATNLFTAPVTGSYALGGRVTFSQDLSTDVQLGVRLVKNGTTTVIASTAHMPGPQLGGETGAQTQTLVALTAGETVELQAIARTNAAFAAAGDTGFWGYLVP